MQLNNLLYQNNINQNSSFSKAFCKKFQDVSFVGQDDLDFALSSYQSIKKSDLNFVNYDGALQYVKRRLPSFDSELVVVNSDFTKEIDDDFFYTKQDLDNGINFVQRNKLYFKEDISDEF